MNYIDIQINNGKIKRIIQTESDKLRCGIGVETLDEKGNLKERTLIGEADFIMLLNYYDFIKENDIKDEFINKNGLNDRYDFKNDYGI